MLVVVVLFVVVVVMLLMVLVVLAVAVVLAAAIVVVVAGIATKPTQPPKRPPFTPHSEVELANTIKSCLRKSPTGDCTGGSHGPMSTWDVSLITNMPRLGLGLGLGFGV